MDELGAHQPGTTAPEPPATTSLVTSSHLAPPQHFLQPPTRRPSERSRWIERAAGAKPAPGYCPAQPLT